MEFYDKICPSILHVSREARGEALKTYRQFTLKGPFRPKEETKIYFNSALDSLWIDEWDFGCWRPGSTDMKNIRCIGIKEGTYHDFTTSLGKWLPELRLVEEIKLISVNPVYATTGVLRRRSDLFDYNDEHVLMPTEKNPKVIGCWEVLLDGNLVEVDFNDFPVMVGWRKKARQVQELLQSLLNAKNGPVPRVRLVCYARLTKEWQNAMGETCDYVANAFKKMNEDELWEQRVEQGGLDFD
jgi:hypothetical protein